MLHKDGAFARGKGLFVPVRWTPAAEVADEEYPFVLSSGRRLYHYHTRTQTGRSKGLNSLMGHDTADISTADAARLGIANGDNIRVSSRRGSVTVQAKGNPRYDLAGYPLWLDIYFDEGNSTRAQLWRILMYTN